MGGGTGGEAVSVPQGSAGGRAVGVLFALIALQVLAYWSTYLSMGEIWWRSETFSHGFFIFPIAAFLIWRKRDELAAIPLRSDLRAAVVLLGLVALWAVARSVDVLVVEQYAAVCMLPVLVWLCLGLPVVKALAFPLAFTLLAVPMGEFLIYPMMEFTAAFTVNAVRLTGIPVYWEGMYFTLPSGTWNIVEGCSGVRYIIASVTLGVLYAYLTYHSYWRRAAFILMACIFPVFANGMRAFIIVMLGHLSDMKIATGVDHLIYGWVWFGIVMFIMFWIGGYWRDDAPAETARIEPQVGTAPRRAWYAYAAPALVLLLLGPVWMGVLDARMHAAGFHIAAPVAGGGWSETGAFTEWKPQYINPDDELSLAYTDGEGDVGVYLAYYSHTKENSELVNTQNVMIRQKHPVWRQPTQERRRVTIGGKQIDLLESTLKSDTQHLLTWHWNRIGAHDTSDPYRGKIYEALTRLSGGGHDGFGIVVYAPYGENPDPAREKMQAFLDVMMPAIDAVLRTD